MGPTTWATLGSGTHRSLIVPILCIFLLSCQNSLPPADAPIQAPPPQKILPAAVAHGGVGSPLSRVDGCRAAVDASLAILEAGGDIIDAAVAGVVVLEDDPRFNAGTGSRVRLDGETVQMDASVMHSSGAFGGVAIIEHVKNPVLVAQAVLDTPHILMAGDGATRFARTLGMPFYDAATTERREKTQEIIEQLRRQDEVLPEAWLNFDWRTHWNFEKTLEEAGLSLDEVGHDTVGVVVRSADGEFAAALSTGGTAITLRGRVGDVPIFGAGLFAGPHGAIAATGTGERIVEAQLATSVHQRIADGIPPAQVAADAVQDLRQRGSIGLIGITKYEITGMADREMAWAGRELHSPIWHGPEPTP